MTQITKHKKMKKNLISKLLPSNKRLYDLIVSNSKAKKNYEKMQSYLSNLKNTWNENIKNMKLLEERLNSIKAKIDYIKEVLKEYYINVLREGIDTK